MNVRHHHVPIDRLTALAFVARAPESEGDQQAMTHITGCQRCSAELARLTIEADTLRDAACAAADEVFDEAMLDAQRTRILDRLAHLGQAARVLRFPARTREVTMPVSVGSRRWVSVAAAAGLIIGLVAGQLVHFVPGLDIASHRENAALQAPSRQPVMVPAGLGNAQSLSDDELLAEIDEAVQARAVAFRAMDALTPIAGDFHDPIGR